jgi:glycine/D-amino acid oxidase-like deaminating enzyme
MDRRAFLQHGVIGAGALSGSLMLPGIAHALSDPLDSLVPIRATADRLFRVTVCLRPFRASGPRIERERVGSKHVVHHYGHGGSGWSLSWGSAEVALDLAQADGAREIAVIGAGAIGLTTALTALRRGVKVTIYAKDFFPRVRSAYATGSWTPDSRVAMAGKADAGFADRWESMARSSFAIHQSFLGLPGTPVEWSDRYVLSDTPPEQRVRATPAAPDPRGEFLHLESARLGDITPRSQPITGPHPFAAQYVRRGSALVFNVADLAHVITGEILGRGGKFEIAEFHGLGDFSRIREKVIVNCTGYGARALCKDESVVPVRGQIAWLIPQAGATYGLYKDGVSVLARRDGIVVQPVGPDEWFGFNDDNESPDRDAAVAAVQALAAMYAAPV